MVLKSPECDKEHSMNKKDGLWMAGYGEIGATLKVLQDLGIDRDDLKRVRTDSAFARRLACQWKEGAILPSAITVTPFQEPASHRLAREILGKDFLGVAAAQNTFGAYTEAQLVARMEIPFPEDVLRACAGEFALLCTHEMDLPGIHAAHAARFKDDPDAPWFSQRDQREKWSSEKIALPWMLVRKKLLPNSTGKNIDAQKKHVMTFSREHLLLPCEHAYAALRLLLETGQKLCEGFSVRFPVLNAKGDWVDVRWNGGQLYFSHWIGNADISIGSSVRTS